MKKSDIKKYTVMDTIYIDGELDTVCNDPMTAQDIIDMLIFRRQEGYITKFEITKYGIIAITSHLEHNIAPQVYTDTDSVTS